MVSFGNEKKTLDPIRHRTKDFFVAEILTCALKDEMTSIEPPIFTLKTGDTKTREYVIDDTKITITPSNLGRATVRDKDLWVFCISQIVNALNNGETATVGDPVRFTAYDYLVSTNRQVGGHEYRDLRDSLMRLLSTKITTDTSSKGLEKTKGFTLIDDFELTYKDQNKTQAVEIQVELPMWLWWVIEEKHIRPINPDYFRINRDIDQLIYDECQKHIGEKRTWDIGVSLLQSKCGSDFVLHRFKEHIKNLADENRLPDFTLSFDSKKDKVIFEKRPDPTKNQLTSKNIRYATSPAIETTTPATSDTPTPFNPHPSFDGSGVNTFNRSYNKEKMIWANANDVGRGMTENNLRGWTVSSSWYKIWEFLAANSSGGSLGNSLFSKAPHRLMAPMSSTRTTQHVGVGGANRIPLIIF